MVQSGTPPSSLRIKPRNFQYVGDFPREGSGLSLAVRLGVVGACSSTIVAATSATSGAFGSGGEKTGTVSLGVFGDSAGRERLESLVKKGWCASGWASVKMSCDLPATPAQNTPAFWATCGAPEASGKSRKLYVRHFIGNSIFEGNLGFLKPRDLS